MVNIEHVKFGALSAVLVLAILTTAHVASVILTMGDGHSTVFAQNITSTLDNGDDIGGTDPSSESKDELIASGNNAQELGNYTGAIEYYDKVLAIDPNDVDALNNKGAAFSSLGNHTEAIEYYDKVLAIDPNDVDALNNKGVAFSSLGNYTEAIEYYNKVLAIDPNDVDALNNKEEALNLGNNNNGAIIPVSESSDSDNDSSSNDDSNDSNDESSGSDNDDDSDNNDDSESEQDVNEDEFEKSNPLRDHIRNRVNGELSASGIGNP